MELDRVAAQGLTQHAITTQPGPSDGEARNAIAEYLIKNSEQFKKLSELRQKGWDNPAGDEFFARQRANADRSNHSSKTSKEIEQQAKRFYDMMIRIGKELDADTGGLKITSDVMVPHILDMCMAPGGFLFAALQRNPNAMATSYTLPFEGDGGGHRVFLPDSANVTRNFLDITMLAADMGVEQIPQQHPDRANFLPRHFNEREMFDLVLCDGQLLRTHRRAAYREHSESHRLATTQLALGLEHLRPGGTMIVLLHKTEEPRTLEIMRQFHQFSAVQLFKPTVAHTARSSFYMVAKDIQTDHAEAVRAVEEWKRTWNIATFGTEEEFKENIRRDRSWAEQILESFGPVLVEKSKAVWETQILGLEKAPYITGATTSK